MLKKLSREEVKKILESADLPGMVGFRSRFCAGLYCCFDHRKAQNSLINETVQ